MDMAATYARAPQNSTELMAAGPRAFMLRVDGAAVCLCEWIEEEIGGFPLSLRCLCVVRSSEAGCSERGREGEKSQPAPQPAHTSVFSGLSLDYTGLWSSKLVGYDSRYSQILPR